MFKGRIQKKLIRKRAKLEGLEAEYDELIKIKNSLKFSPHAQIGMLVEKMSLLKQEIEILETKLK